MSDERVVRTSPAESLRLVREAIAEGKRVGHNTMDITDLSDEAKRFVAAELKKEGYWVANLRWKLMVRWDWPTSQDILRILDTA